MSLIAGQKTALGAAFIFCVVFVALRFDLFSAKAKTDPCFTEETVRSCLMNKAHHMAMGGDVKGALAFVADTIAPFNRNTAHFAMHMVGMAAYDALGSRRVAMDQLPENAATYEEFLTYEGYQHGLLMEYFHKEIDKKPIMDLIHESCDSHWVAENPRTEDFSWTANMQCFHAVGHGLLYAYDGSVPKALSVCSQLPYPWMKGRCAYGALMEEAYQYNQNYSMKIGETPPGNNMADLCNSLSEFESECALFAGRSHLSGHFGDFAGAFSACSKLTGGDTSANALVCREQIAMIAITDAGLDFNLMKERCKTADGFEEECLLNVARAVVRGYAGKAAQKKNFCATLPKSLNEKCALFETH